MSETNGRAEKDAGAAPDLWVARELGAFLRLSEKSIYRLTKATPPIPHIKIGGAVRFPREATLRWLRARTKGK
jgi:predicted DNA-binding transcriptional regulator AlpA